MRIVKSEWHQVERRYALELQRSTIDEVYPDNTEEENNEIWEQISEDGYDYSQLIDDSNETKVYLDWEWLDEDDWWTDRKGGYEVTFEIDPDYEPPKTDKDRILDLRNEVNALLAKLGEEEKYDTRPDDVRLRELQSLFDEELESEEEQSAHRLVKCTKCDWHGDFVDTDNNDSGVDYCPECGSHVESED